MYERFTDRARRVMQLANQEANLFSHGYIGVEHVLVGLLKEERGNAFQILRELGVDAGPELLKRIQGTMIPGPDITMTLGKLPQTPVVRRAIEEAVAEARRQNHNYVGTEHVLFGLVLILGAEDPESVWVWDFLNRIPPESVRARIEARARLQAAGSPEAPLTDVRSSWVWSSLAVTGPIGPMTALVCESSSWELSPDGRRLEGRVVYRLPSPDDKGGHGLRDALEAMRREAKEALDRGHSATACALLKAVKELGGGDA